MVLCPDVVPASLNDDPNQELASPGAVVDSAVNTGWLFLQKHSGEAEKVGPLPRENLLRPVLSMHECNSLPPHPHDTADLFWKDSRQAMVSDTGKISWREWGEPLES